MFHDNDHTHGAGDCKNLRKCMQTCEMLSKHISLTFPIDTRLFDKIKNFMFLIFARNPPSNPFIVQEEGLSGGYFLGGKAVMGSNHTPFFVQWSKKCISECVDKMPQGCAQMRPDALKCAQMRLKVQIAYLAITCMRTTKQSTANN